MTAHPYPQKIRQAVANEVCLQILGKPLVKTGDQTRHAFLIEADQILTALWEASRVDTLSDVEELMPNALIRTGNGQPRTYMWAGGVAMKQNPDLLPAHVIYWGDAS